MHRYDGSSISLFFALKIKSFLIVPCIALVSIICIERDFLMDNLSLIVANTTHDMSHYSWELSWVARYNQAIWFSGSGRYEDAKKLLTPLLSNMSLPKSGEIAELYGDLIYTTSGSLDDVIHMYERSLSFAPSDRVTSKIAWIREQARSEKTATGITEKTRETNTGSQDLDLKKTELQNTSAERGKYIDMTTSSQDGASTLRQLVESIKSGSTPITQDW